MYNIDGDKFICLIGFSEEARLTPIMIANRLHELGVMEVNQIVNVCAIHDLERAAVVFPELISPDDLLKLPYTGSDYDTPERIKRRIKHCKNPMEKIQLQRELNYSYKYWNNRA